jgi:hypothetical protein
MDVGKLDTIGEAGQFIKELSDTNSSSVTA